MFTPIDIGCCSRHSVHVVGFLHVLSTHSDNNEAPDGTEKENWSHGNIHDRPDVILSSHLSVSHLLHF